MPRETTTRRVEWYLGPSTEIMPEKLNDYDTPEWSIEPKLDGMWAMLTVTENGNVLKSRDARTPIITGANAGELPGVDTGLPVGTVIVGELEAATQWAKETHSKFGYRRFHVFDVPKFGDRDLRGTHLSGRRAFLRNRVMETIRASSSSKHFLLVPRYIGVQGDNFRSRYDKWIETGYEGCVIKRNDSVYSTHRMDGKTELWLRCKKHVTEDYVFMGVKMTPGGKYSQPKITGIWGLYKDGDFVEVLTATAPIEILGNPGRYERKLVAEFRGWERFASGSIRHAQFVRIRTDKSPKMCTGVFGK